jgi:hypothetical protein
MTPTATPTRVPIAAQNTLTQSQQAGIGIGSSFAFLICCGLCISCQRKRKEPEAIKPVTEDARVTERRKSVVDERRVSVVLRQVSVNESIQG